MPITYKDDVFLITTENMTYAFSKNADNTLTNLHWGGRITDTFDLPEAAEIRGLSDYDLESDEHKRGEYLAWGKRLFREPCLKAEFSDGVRDCELRYFSHSISEDSTELTVTLRDSVYPLAVHLHYKIYAGLDLIDRYAVFENLGKDKIKIENAMSGCVYLPDCGKYNITLMGSSWAREYDLERKPLSYGKLTVESRTLYSDSSYYPYFALDSGNAAENVGEVWFGTLQWCGNYKMCIENKRSSPVYITAGLNDFDFAYILSENESLTTPVFTYGYTKKGFGAASRMFHDLQKIYIAPRKYAYEPLPVVYNAWAAFEMDIDAPKLMALADKAAYIGAELFVVDDGWFGTREDTSSGLGDWYPNKKKFPNGLGELIKKVNSLGMKFGLWIEPEMVNPTSELYKKHPDWIFSFPTREPELQREQLMLNIAKPEVKEYIIDVLDKLLSENNIEYLKWDSNRFLGQPGWENAEKERQREYHYRYTRAIYDIFAFINEKYPNVIVENCAAGGMRSDLSLAHYCSRINRSDNQDPRDEILLHEGFTYVNRSKSAGGGGHVSKSPAGINGRYTPLKFRAYAAMLGSFAVGYDLMHIPENELEDIKKYIQLHKQYRDIVQNGDMYRLVSAREDDFAAYEYVSADKKRAVVFVFGINLSFAREIPYIRLCGLEDDFVYTIDGKKKMSGRGLSETGLFFKLHGDYDCAAVYIEKTER